ncbi:neuroblastoma-amplified sequence [Lasius niger]|uniref:Neuroblastoma-amplified sequence n=1 Tax=Lasius niger TaxID=67767 RepID=A0A0J7KZC9_LASNI|nr:neuroblastoma-amplified sequence [Lasius niger]
MSNLNEASNEPILYELLEYFVRKQEPELIKCKSDAAILPATGTIKSALRYLNNRYSLSESISLQVSLTLPWKFAVGDHGRVLAILQENVIEIRKAKDEYSSVVGKASAPKDAFPRWRKIEWSPDGMILVLASSSGYTSFYNALGNNIFNISPKTISQNPQILEGCGLLRSYHISTHSFSINYDFSFGNFYKNGINAVAYDEKHNLFYVAGNMITQKLTAIIIARYSGSTSVCSTWNLKNLLGISPEFLAGQPQVCELGSEKGFLCLDCETFITSKKRSREPNDGHLSEASSESEKDDNELEPVTLLNYTTNLLQNTLYSITDIERFQPKRKKLKVLHQTYRILGVKSTTPEELYSRKIDIEEYEEALTLANTYNLDTDLVYQTQWRKSELSLNAIAEHLSKISKRSWVLNECVVRIPDTMETARELLNFGLRAANLETLIAIDICDNDKIVTPDTEDDWQALDESTVSKKASKSFIDKLLTYEIILESLLKYKKEFYEEFRRLSAVENAIRFAKDCDFRGVEIMFTYYGEKCDLEGQLFLLDQRELRQKDWSEKYEFNEIINENLDDGSEMLYELDPSLLIYRNTQLTPDLLQKWYKTRAYEIEKNSALIDNALQLVKIAKSHNINGMEDLLLDLETLNDFVYNVYLRRI